MGTSNFQIQNSGKTLVFVAAKFILILIFVQQFIWFVLTVIIIHTEFIMIWNKKFTKQGHVYKKI